MASCLTFMLLALQAWITLAGEFCYEKHFRYLFGYIYHTDNYFYCDTGCCGSLYDRSCCPSIVGAIIGGVLGGIFFIVCCIIVIVLICKCRRQRGASGTVLRPATTQQQSNTVAVISQGQSQPPLLQHTQPYIQAGQPMAYHYQQMYSPPVHQVASGSPYMSNKATQPPPYYNPATGDLNYKQ